MTLFLTADGLDKIAGDCFGLGKEFDNGPHVLGPLALTMIGIATFPPLLAGWLPGVVGSVVARAEINPAMVLALLIPIGTGYYPLAYSMAANGLEAGFTSLVMASMIGATVTLSVPITLPVLRQEGREPMVLGTVAGLIALPIGCLVGGLVVGLALIQVSRNLLLVLLFALLLALTLLASPEKSIRRFILFGKRTTCLITLVLIMGCFQEMTDIVWVKGLAPLRESFEVLGSVAVILAGAYPMVAVMRGVLGRPLGAFGKLLGINGAAAAGLLSSPASGVSMMSLVYEMDYRGKVMNLASAVCVASIFGGHLGFCSAVALERTGALMTGKLAGGGVATLMAAVSLRVSKGEKRK